MYRILGNIDVGRQAPDFRARDVLGREINLADYRGRNNVVLFFYRNRLCQTCREELADLRDEYQLISEQDGEVIAISNDGIDMAKDMAVDLQLPYPVISDRDAGIIKLYGVFDDDVGTAYPALILVDKNGVVRYLKKIEGLNDLVPADEVVNRLKDQGTVRGKKPFKSSRFQQYPALDILLPDEKF